MEDPGIDGRTVLLWIFEKWHGGIDWMDLAENKDRLGAFVNAVMDLWVS